MDEMFPEHGNDFSCYLDETEQPVDSSNREVDLFIGRLHFKNKGDVNLVAKVKSQHGLMRAQDHSLEIESNNEMVVGVTLTGVWDKDYYRCTLSGEEINAKLAEATEWTNDDAQQLHRWQCPGPLTNIRKHGRYIFVTASMTNEMMY